MPLSFSEAGMTEVTELSIEVMNLDFVTLPGPFPGVGTRRLVPAVAFYGSVTDRLLISEDAVRVIGVGR